MSEGARARAFPTALVLAFASLVATALASPYLLAVMPRYPPMRAPVLVVVLAAQAGLEALLLGWAGLRLGERVNLGAPYVQAWMARRAGAGSRAVPPAHWGASAVAGLLCAAVIAILDRLVFLPRQPEALLALSREIAPWRGLLAAFHGGIVEETLVRLFFMTAIVWLLSKAVPRQGGGAGQRAADQGRMSPAQGVRFRSATGSKVTGA